MKIYVYKNGSAALVDETKNVGVVENGQRPTQVLEATPDNMKKYLPNLNKKPNI